ncbi:MAG: RNA polymerase sigma factor [Roseburia sp.]
MVMYLSMLDTQEKQSLFEQIYLCYRKQMYFAAYRILQHEQDAEDAVHLAFLKIAENIEKISDAECPKTRSLCVTIVENKAIDIYRKRQRSVNIGWEEFIPESQPSYTGTGRLGKCIAMLPPIYRHVLILHHLHGYKYREIAQILGITTANALKIDQRAKVKLEKICIEEGIL